MTSLSRLDGAYHAAKLLIEQRHQQQGTLHQLQHPEEPAATVSANPREAALASLQRDRLMFLLHAKLFMHSFVSLWCANLSTAPPIRILGVVGVTLETQPVLKVIAW